jgi:hypothetical protein
MHTEHYPDAAPPPASSNVPTVFGILNLAWFGMAICGGVMALPMLTLEVGEQHDNVAFRVLAENEFALRWTQVMTVVGSLAACLLLAGGIGLLMRRAWGRRLSLVWAFFALLTGLVGTAVSWLYYLAPLMEQAKELTDAERMGANLGVVAAACGALCGLLYPVVLLVFMTRPSLKAALR